MKFAADVKKHVKTPVAAVGSFSDPAMMEKALSALSAAGYTQCKLWALANNEHAAGFYKKMGFAPDGGETFLQLGSPARCIRSAIIFF